MSTTTILGIMRKLKYSLCRNAPNQMYMSYLLPIVEYASVIWNGCSEQDLVILQKILNEAAQLVTGFNETYIIRKPVQRMWIGNSIIKKTTTSAFFHV